MTSLSNIAAYHSQSTYVGKTCASCNDSPKKAAETLDSILQTSGLSSSDKASLKTDLKNALQQQFDSGSFPPDTSKLESAVKGVFSKYGLDADKLAQKLAPPGGFGPSGGALPPVGGPNSPNQDGDSIAISSTSTTTTALQKFLQQLLLQHGNKSQATGDSLVNALVGFNATV